MTRRATLMAALAMKDAANSVEVEICVRSSDPTRKATMAAELWKFCTDHRMRMNGTLLNEYHAHGNGGQDVYEQTISFVG